MQRHLLHIVVLLLVLCGCVSRSRYEAMRSGLDSINERNRSDQPFTASDVQPYVDFFDSHGEPNDRLLAYYLLGRAYHEQGEAPMALECYQKAIECADTISEDCDYSQLSKAFGQMGVVFYEQSLYRQHLLSTMQAERYSWKAKDTLSALINCEQQSISYHMLGELDSAIIVANNVSGQFSQFGLNSDAAITKGSIVRALLLSNNFEEAKKYMQEYESKSGFFNVNGDIEKGRESYYNTKGLFYLRSNQLDSAEFWFRKELSMGRDFNNQDGGALGLAMIYDQRHQTDSASKYYAYAYTMKDSLFTQKTTIDVGRMQAMYNYSRFREIARKESETASRRIVVIWFSVIFIIIICMVFFIIYERINHKRKRLELLYFQSLEIIKEARQDIVRLSGNLRENKDIIDQKKDIIHRQKDILRSLSSDTLLYKQFVIMGKEPTTAEWDQIKEQVFLLYPQFKEFMDVHENLINDKEYKTCILIRAGFKPKTISDMLGVGPSYISNIRSEMLKTLFNRVGKSKEFDSFILSFIAVR